MAPCWVGQEEVLQTGEYSYEQGLKGRIVLQLPEARLATMEGAITTGEGMVSELNDGERYLRGEVFRGETAIPSSGEPTSKRI